MELDGIPSERLEYDALTNVRHHIFFFEYAAYVRDPGYSKIKRDQLVLTCS